MLKTNNDNGNFIETAVSKCFNELTTTSSDITLNTRVKRLLAAH